MTRITLERSEALAASTDLPAERRTVRIDGDAQLTYNVLRAAESSEDVAYLGTDGVWILCRDSTPWSDVVVEASQAPVD